MAREHAAGAVEVTYPVRLVVSHAEAARLRPEHIVEIADHVFAATPDGWALVDDYAEERQPC